MPSPSSLTSSTTIAPLPRAVDRTVIPTAPAPCSREFSTSTPMASRSRPGVACTTTSLGQRTASVRFAAASRGPHSASISASSSNNTTSPAPAARSDRAFASRSSTTATSRSVCSSASPTSSTTNGSGCSASSSRRSRRPVSRVLSWCEMSPARSRSREISAAMSWADESSTSATRSSSGTPYRRRNVLKSPEPSRAARLATSVSGVTSRPAVSSATPVPTTTDSNTASATSASAVHCSARR